MPPTNTPIPNFAPPKTDAKTDPTRTTLAINSKIRRCDSSTICGSSVVKGSLGSLIAKPKVYSLSAKISKPGVIAIVKKRLDLRMTRLFPKHL